jgi:hypothetical protein
LVFTIRAGLRANMRGPRTYLLPVKLDAGSARFEYQQVDGSGCHNQHELCFRKVDVSFIKQRVPYAPTSFV